MNMTLNDVKEKVIDSGNPNPSIWIKSDLETDNGKAVVPSEIVIDDGDIIISVNMELLSDC